MLRSSFEFLLLVTLLNLLTIIVFLDQISAHVQASFRLEKPVSQLIPYIERLEDEIFDEISLPNTKVLVKLLLLHFFPQVSLPRHKKWLIS